MMNWIEKNKKEKKKSIDDRTDFKSMEERFQKIKINEKNKKIKAIIVE